MWALPVCAGDWVVLRGADADGGGGLTAVKMASRRLTIIGVGDDK